MGVFWGKKAQKLKYELKGKFFWGHPVVNTINTRSNLVMKWKHERVTL